MPFDTSPAEPRRLEPWQQLLLDAADVIDQRGHTKGVQEDGPGGPVCAHGALSIAAYGHAHMECCIPEDPTEKYLKACDAVAAVLIRRGTLLPGELHSFWIGGKECQVFAAWNNQPARTAYEVTSIMREAAREELGVKTCVYF